MGVNVKDDNRIPDLLVELEKFNQSAVEVGIFADEDAEIAKIARTHEFGATITPKNARALSVPLNREAALHEPGDFDDLFMLKRDNDNKPPLLVRQAGEDIEPMYVLLQSVTIPERSFIRATFDKKRNEITKMTERDFLLLLNEELSAKGLMDRLGLRFVGEIVKHIEQLDTPPNSPLTVRNKSTSSGAGDSPLEDTGHLKSQVTYKVVSK